MNLIFVWESSISGASYDKERVLTKRTIDVSEYAELGLSGLAIKYPYTEGNENV